LSVNRSEELSRAFEELAELSEIKGEVRFKVNAYHKAAEIARARGEELLALDDVKELRRYPGIGEGIAKKILEFKRTGTISKLEELKEEVPVELLSLLQVPNLGPKRAKLIYDELGGAHAGGAAGGGGGASAGRAPWPGAQGGTEHPGGHKTPAVHLRAASAPHRTPHPGGDLPRPGVGAPRPAHQPGREPQTHEGDHRGHRYPGGLPRAGGGHGVLLFPGDGGEGAAAG